VAEATLKRRRRWLWLASAAFAAVAIAVAPERRARVPFATRLLGPLAPLAAHAQWLRADAAIEDGRIDLALARAELAFALEPADFERRIALSHYLAFELASPERETDPARRLAWLRAALDVVRRGEERARDPGALAIWAGLMLAKAAATDPELAWPGGTEGLWRDAADEFARAARAGSADAPELERRARAETELARGED
jgi:hypothetical protein